MAINVSLMLPISIITTTKKTLPLCHSIPLLFTTGQLWIATPWSLITGLGRNGIYRHIDPKILRLSHILYYIPLFNAAYLNLTHLPKQNTDSVVLTTLPLPVTRFLHWGSNYMPTGSFSTSTNQDPRPQTVVSVSNKI